MALYELLVQAEKIAEASIHRGLRPTKYGQRTLHIVMEMINITELKTIVAYNTLIKSSNHKKILMKQNWKLKLTLVTTLYTM